MFKKFVPILIIISLFVGTSLYFPDLLPKEIAVKQALAHSQFTATGGLLVTGTETTIVSSTATGNTGSWKGTLALETTSPGYNWTVTSNATNGLNQQLMIDGVNLNNSNKFEITMSTLAGATTLALQYQICDWVSTTSVDTVADAQCTGGGWRTMNIREVNITKTTMSSHVWHIYDGYFTTGTTSNTPVSTPLSNFISPDANKRILIRAYSTSAVAVTHGINFLQLNEMIDPVYMPAGFTQLTGGTVSTSYINTTNGTLTGQSGNDGTYLTVPGTASALSTFYTSFKNVRTYTGMNSIVYVAEQLCSATGINVTPKIYNFTTTSWEALSAPYACSTSVNLTKQFAIYTANINDYISNGEIRVGWFGSANAATSISIDYQYIIVGSVVENTGSCEISFGTGTAANCVNTRTMDSTLASPSTWQVTTELKSATFGHTYYAYDTDAAANTNAAMASNLDVPITLPPNAGVTGIGYVMRWRSNATTVTTQGQLKDHSGSDVPINGGWTVFGATNASATYGYEDVITNGYFTSNPNDYVDTTNNEINMRVRTSATTATANITGDIDFALATIRWVEAASPHQTMTSQFTATGGLLVTGTETTIVSSTATGNTGSWKGTLALETTSPGYNWTVTSNATNGLNQQLMIDGVNLNNSNKFEITMSTLAGATTLALQYQICDWVSTTSVDTVADAQCTGGGWRTMNIREVNITKTTMSSHVWHIYDGYFTTGTTSNTPVSTPLSNFISPDANKRILIRAYSTSAVAVTHGINFLQLNEMIDPVYMPAGFTQLTGGTVSTSYINTTNGTLTGQSGNDGTYLTVPGTASALSTFYTSFKNVRTYTGMNSIVYVAEQLCSATGINVTPKIYNFTTTSWEALSAPYACSTSVNLTKQFAIYTANINDYISNGEIRVGWFGSANAATSISIDYQYIIVGSVVENTGSCEISFGTGTAANCVNTRTMDSTLASPSTWQVTTELKSATFGHDYYAYDMTAAANAYSAMSRNLEFPVTLPTNAGVTGLAYAMRWRSNITTVTTLGQFKDKSGSNATINGGWTTFGTSNAATTYSYEDSITNPYFTSNPVDYVDTVNNIINIRVNTSGSTAATAATGDVDYVMATIRWVEKPVTGSLSMDIVDSGGATVSSPSLNMNASALGFNCQTVNGVLGSANQKIRVSNDSASPAWTLSVAAAGGAADKWTTGSVYYDYNDSSGSPAGCSDGGDADNLAGQLSIDPSASTISPEAGCSSANLSLGANASFVQGSTDAITLLSANSSAQSGCYFELTNIGLAQTIPAEQTLGNYNMNLVLTVTAN